MSPQESLFHHQKITEDSSTKNLSAEELFLYSIDHFHDSLEKRAEMGARTALWTNRVIRSGIFGLMLIAASILILVVLVSKEMTKIADMMTRMDTHMEIIVQDTREMAVFVQAMDQSVATMPVINQEISTMVNTINGMNENVSVISQEMDNTSVIVENIIYNVEGMDQNLDSVSYIVRGMDYSIDKVARPFKLFNQFMPMP